MLLQIWRVQKLAYAFVHRVKTGEHRVPIRPDE